MPDDTTMSDRLSGPPLTQPLTQAAHNERSQSRSHEPFTQTPQAGGLLTANRAAHSEQGRSVMVLLWYYYGITMVLLWYHYGITMVLLWYCSGTS